MKSEFMGAHANSGADCTRNLSAKSSLDTKDMSVGLKRSFVATGVLLTICASAFGSMEITFSVAIGAIISLLNIAYLQRFLKTVMNGSVSPLATHGLTSFSFIIRVSLVAFLIYKLIESQSLHMPALVVGLSSTLLSVILWFVFKGRKEV